MEESLERKGHGIPVVDDPETETVTFRLAETCNNLLMTDSNTARFSFLKRPSLTDYQVTAGLREETESLRSKM